MFGEQADLESWYWLPDGRLEGVVYNHPRLGNCRTVTTSPVERLDADIRTVRTKSGTLYRLGRPLYQHLDFEHLLLTRMLGHTTPGNRRVDESM